MYTLLAPLAIMAIAVWLVDGLWLRVLTTIFVLYSVVLHWMLPTTGRIDGNTGLSWALRIFAAGVATAVAWDGDLLPLVLIVLAVALLLRLWYRRQYHLQQGQQDRMELLRRCLLISLWSHISVLAAWLSPY